MDEEDIVCPICGKGTYPYKKWIEEGSYSLRIRATWGARPYPKKGTAWFYRAYLETPATPVHGIVENVSFGRCGYQEIELGLTLSIKLEDGGGVCWTFYNYGDIAEFFERAKVYDLQHLVGTPVLAFMSGEGGIGSRILGIDVIDSLVIRRRE